MTDKTPVDTIDKQQSEPDEKKPKNKKKIILIIVGVVVGLCLICLIFGFFLQGLETTGILPTSEPTATPADTLTSEPSATLELSPTPEPTDTPEPTSTPAPTLTNTTIPTNTPEPEPIVLTGSGDDVVDFENPFDAAIVKITGNMSSRHFAVKNYGSDGENYDLLVNTTDPYEGVVPIDFFQGEHTTRFEVTAMGEWSIEVLPLTEARELSVPGSIEGSGDEVIRLSGSNPDIANIVGNAESRHFAVVGYGNNSDLLVNTTEPYEGRVILDVDTVILEITAHGEWSIEIE